jgi:hypothetical protein
MDSMTNPVKQQPINKQNTIDSRTDPVTELMVTVTASKKDYTIIIIT